MTQAKLENIVLLVLIAAGVSLGIYYRTAGDNQLSAILFSLAFASVLYKFLGGGGEQNSLSLGVIKFGGSAAVLGGFIWLLSQVIFVDEAATGLPTDLNFRTTPSTNWYPADTETGAPTEVALQVGDSTISLPLHDINTEKIETRRFELNEFEDGKFHVQHVGNQQEILGQVLLSDIKGNYKSLVGRCKEPAHIDLFKLYPNRGGQRSTAELENLLIKTEKREQIFPFPFVLRTYGTTFSIKMRNDKSVVTADKEIMQKNPILVEDTTGKCSWLVFPVHANLVNPDTYNHYSEWVVLKLERNNLFGTPCCFLFMKKPPSSSLALPEVMVILVNYVSQLSQI